MSKPDKFEQLEEYAANYLKMSEPEITEFCKVYLAAVSDELDPNVEMTDCQRFRKDMEKAGLEIIEYRGRWYWQGPAVVVDNIQEVASKTKVKLQHDYMGLQFVVYPVDRDSS
jgi:hypothetical protein